MVSERTQRQIDRLLEQAEEAISRFHWDQVRECALAVLALDPDNVDARDYLSAAERRPQLDETGRPLTSTERSTPPDLDLASALAPHPTSFADGRYEVVRFLGEGGTKRVYLAHDTALDRDVALALVKAEGLDEAGLQRIGREWQAIGRLGGHPHIVDVYELSEERGQPYIVSEFLYGGDIGRLLQDAPDHQLPLDQVLRIADQICQALEHAHSRGIVHRDLKPSNVLLTSDLQANPSQAIAKLGDFGLAVALDRARLTQAGLMVGTAAYLSPEQAIGGVVDARSDLYSLGAMLYEMVTGRPPFIGEEPVAIISQHLNIPPVAPTWHRPGLPAGLEALILRLLEKNPDRRCASASEVHQILASIKPGQAVAGGPPTPVSTDAPNPNGPIYRRTFVGREEEVRRLRAAFDGAISGRGTVVTVVGEPGIGKTALCEQVATYAALRGGRVLVGHCYEEGSLSLPYLPFVEALRSYVLTRDPDGLRDDLGTGAADVARIISEVRDRVSVEARPPGDPDDDRWRLLQAVSGFLKNAATVQPIVLVLEDLHWADRGTMDLLLHLARNVAGARLLVIPTYRDIEVDRAHPLSSALAELRRISGFDRVLLRGLTPDEVHRMINGMQEQEVRWSFAEAVHRQTEGNPLFVQEVLRYLVEEGLILRKEGRWEGRWRETGEPPPELSIPEGLRDVIGRRLSKLSDACNRALTVAAVIGRDFDFDTLRTVADSSAGSGQGLSEDEVTDALEEAVRVGVLQEQRRPLGLEFRFTHAFFRQTLYEELFTPRRLRLHQQVARALEARYAGRLDEHAAELAEHFSQSSDPADLTKAIEYGQLAARRAMGVYAYGEAVRLLDKTLEAQDVVDPGDKATRCDLLLALGVALGPAGEPQRAIDEVAPEALELAESLGDDARASLACEVARQALSRYGGSTILFTPVFEQWAERADRYAAPGTRARVHADLFLAARRGGEDRHREAWDLRERAFALARHLGDPETLFEVAASILDGLGPQGEGERLRVAEEFSFRSRDGVSTSRVWSLLYLSHHIYLQTGQLGRAQEVDTELEQLAPQLHDPRIALMLMVHHAGQAVLRGELEEAVALGRDITVAAEEAGMAVWGRQFEIITTVEPLLYLGRPDEALATVPAAMRLVGVDEARGARVGRREQCLVHLGQVDEAREGLWAHVRRLGISVDRAEAGIAVLDRLLEIAVLMEDLEAVGLLAGHLAGLMATHSGATVHSIARHLGQAAALLGDLDTARKEYDRSLDWATQIRHRPEIALTRLGIAELLLAGSPEERAEAREHLEFAIPEFEAMKMRPALEQAKRLSGAMPPG